MLLLIILALLMVVALILMSLANRAQQRARAKRHQQRQLRLRIELLEEVLDCLLNTLADTKIAEHINNEIMSLLEEVLALEQHNKAHFEALLANSTTRGETLSSAKTNTTANLLRDSDLHIAQTQDYLSQTVQILRNQQQQGKLTTEELNVYVADLHWARLMVSVASFIGQGYRASGRGDVFTATGFYKKAQNALIESMHRDPRRMRLIKELGEIIAGTRKTLGEDLIPDEKLLEQAQLLQQEGH